MITFIIGFLVMIVGMIVMALSLFRFLVCYNGWYPERPAWFARATRGIRKAMNLNDAFFWGIGGGVIVLAGIILISFA